MVKPEAGRVDQLNIQASLILLVSHFNIWYLTSNYSHDLIKKTPLEPHKNILSILSPA